MLRFLRFSVIANTGWAGEIEGRRALQFRGVQVLRTHRLAGPGSEARGRDASRHFLLLPEVIAHCPVTPWGPLRVVGQSTVHLNILGCIHACRLAYRLRVGETRPVAGRVGGHRENGG